MDVHLAWLMICHANIRLLWVMIRSMLFVDNDPHEAGFAMLVPVVFWLYPRVRNGTAPYSICTLTVWAVIVFSSRVPFNTRFSTSFFFNLIYKER